MGTTNDMTGVCATQLCTDIGVPYYWVLQKVWLDAKLLGAINGVTVVYVIS